MPKSYLANEPACQRAELTFLIHTCGVSARLQALHPRWATRPTSDRLAVLGGTWVSREAPVLVYQELSCVTSGPTLWPKSTWWYTSFGLQNSEELSSFVAEQQKAIFDDNTTYNQAFHKLYDTSQPHQNAWSQMQVPMTSW